MSILKNWGAIGVSVVACGSLLPQAALADDVASQRRLDAIVTDCTYSAGHSANLKGCLSYFKDQYERSDKEQQATAGFTLFGIFKGGYQNFWGRFEELSYTELTFGQVQYQIGYGYVLASQQYKANAAVTSNVGATAEKGKTSYAASLIGVAPNPQSAVANPLKCGDKQMRGADELLCALDTQPTVTQAYFQNAASMLAHGYADWRTEMQDAVAGKLPAGTEQPRLCPQVIGFRGIAGTGKTFLFDPVKDKDEIDAALQKAITLVAKLRGVCADVPAAGGVPAQPALSNAAVRYHGGEPYNATLGYEGDSNASVEQNTVSVGYFRDVNYFALSTRLTNAQRSMFFAPADQYFDLWLDGISNAQGLPSVLAAIASFKRTSMQQTLHVRLCNAAGQPPVGVMGDPVANPDIFAKLTTDLKTAADGPPSTTQNCAALL